MRLGAVAVEDEVRAVVHERRARRLGRAGQAAHGQRVDRQRLAGPVLGAIHIVERGAVDDEVWRGGGDRRSHSAGIGHVQRLARERDHLAIGKRLDDKGGELSVGPCDEDAIDRQDQ